MVMTFYGLKDVVQGDFIAFAPFSNDASCCRVWGPHFSRSLPMKDIVIYKLYQIDTSNGKIVGDYIGEVVSWDSYKFPETPSSVRFDKDDKQK